VISLGWHTVGISSVFVEAVVPLSAIPELLLTHGGLEFVLEFALFPSLVVVGDEVKGSPEILDGLVIVHVQQQRLSSGQVSLFLGSRRGSVVPGSTHEERF
jgi:hypothetical protein